MTLTWWKRRSPRRTRSALSQVAASSGVAGVTHAVKLTPSGSRGPPRREVPAEHAHHHREEHALEEDARRDLEAEGDHRERRPVRRRVTMPLIGSETRQPSVSSTAISLVRDATAAFMEGLSGCYIPPATHR